MSPMGGDSAGALTPRLELTDATIDAGTDPQFLARVLEATEHAIVSYGFDGRITSWNEAAHRLLGWHRAEAIGQDITLVVSGERAGEQDTIVARAVGGHCVEFPSTTRLHKSGTRVPVSVIASPLRLDPAGPVTGIVTVFRDRTELNRVEAGTRAAAQRNQFLSRLVESSADAMISYGVDGLISSWNPAAEAMFGWTAAEVLGQDALLLVPEGRTDEHLRMLEAALRGDTADYPETERLRRDGVCVPVSLRVAPLHADTGELLGVVCAAGAISPAEGADPGQHARQELMLRLVDASMDAIISHTIDGVITSWNRAAVELFGWSAAEAVGRHINLFVPAGRESEHHAMVEEAWAGRRLELHETDRCHRDGHLVHVTVSAAPVPGDTGELLGVVLEVRAVDDVRKFDEATRAVLLAEKANLAKSEFLSRMSHELRTPLNAILGFAQLLEMGGLDEEQHESVTQILRGGKHLLELVNEVLDIARIESGRLSVSLEPVAVDEVIRECLDMVRHTAELRGVELVHEAAPDTLVVMADRQRLKQVILNLCSNAVKYNREDGVLAVSAGIVDSEVCIDVTDTGPGIAPDKLDRLFTPFDRLGAELTDVEGVGLGLALSMRLVQAMQGSLEVQSELGEGSTFQVRLRAVGDTIDASMDLPHDLPHADGAGLVLYVEDNLPNLRLVERILQKRPQMRLISATRGQLGIELAHEQVPDLIVLDVNLPDMQGHEVLAALRADPAVAHVPVIVASADATTTQVKRMLDAGAADYLTKPLDVLRFLDVIDRHLTPRDGTE